MFITYKIMLCYIDQTNKIKLNYSIHLDTVYGIIMIVNFDIYYCVVVFLFQSNLRAVLS